MLRQEIIKLGLSEKESKVYLASLELGPATVQTISQKAGVNRATTYVIIDSLMEMGLFSTYDEGKKTFFTAEPPERLMEHLKNQEVSIQGKISLLREKMPELVALVSIKTNKPKVKYFEGIEGLRTVQNDFVETLNKGDVIYTFLPFDEFYSTDLRNKVSDIRKKRMDKGIIMRTIYTSRAGRQRQYEKDEERNLKEFLYIDYNEYPFHGGMNIYGNKIFLIDYLGKTGGIVIENANIADTLKSFFQIIWENYKKK